MAEEGKKGSEGTDTPKKIEEMSIEELRTEAKKLKEEVVLNKDRHSNAEITIGKQGEQIGDLKGKLLIAEEKSNDDTDDDEGDFDRRDGDEGVEKEVGKILKPLLSRLAALEGALQSQTLMNEIPELKNPELQKKVLDLLAEEKIAPTPWAVKQAVKVLIGKGDEEIRKEEKDKVLKELREDGKLPEGNTQTGHKEPKTEEEVGDGIVEASKKRQI